MRRCWGWWRRVEGAIQSRRPGPILCGLLLDFLILDGKRLVGFDNERDKGDHKHLDGKESVYRFVSIDQLLEDFIAEVERRVE